MFELVLLACLATSPYKCKDVHLTYTGEVPSLLQCVVTGQPEMAKWALYNPRWRVRKWRCGPVQTARAI